MNTRILGGNPSREKTTAAVAQPSIFYYRENILQHMCWRSLLPACRHPPALVYQPLLEGSYDPLLSFTSLSWKGATTPWSRLPASPGRELRPPDWRQQPSAPPWTMFHQFSHWIQPTSIEHNLQALFHQIFRLDPLHTFKLNHTTKLI